MTSSRVICKLMNFPKKVLAVFAHPDDESFGPGGILALWAEQGVEIHLLCATYGEAGQGKKLGEIRSEELRVAGKILGIKKVEFLDFKDGRIGNQDLAKLEKIITDKVNRFRPDTILTFDLNGVSGHLDHIAVASATTQAFRKTMIAKRLYYFTIPKTFSDMVKDYFIYFPEGKRPEEADEKIDVSSVWKKRISAMDQYQSQKKDIDEIKKKLELGNKEEWFTVKLKSD